MMLDNWFFARAQLMRWPELFFYRPKQLVKRNFIDRYFSTSTTSDVKLKTNPNFEGSSFSSNFIELKIKTEKDLDCYFLFGKTKVILDKPIEWRKDYKNDIVSPINFYADISRQDFKTNGDVKYVAELSRFHFFPYLALKTASDNTYLDVIENHLSDWINQNPYLRSINWSSGIEIGIRSVNLIYTHQVLSSFNILTDEIDRLVKKIIALSYTFLKSHLSKYSSGNNHRVAELTALVAISSYFTSNELKRNREKWKNLFIKEIEHQTHTDGVNKEKAVRYHAEVLDHFLNGVLFLEKADIDVPQMVYDQLQAMLEFIDSCHYNGNVIEFGDSDDGHLIHPYFDNNYTIYSSLLQSARIKFGLNVDCPSDIDFRNYLLFGDQAEKIQKEKVSHLESSRDDKLYTEGGYCFMYDNEQKVRVIFDVGKIGDDLTSAHGHSDLLHFTLELNGEPIIIDPGTYQYHSKDRKFRDYFRGITAHNTISVNGLDHATPCTRMGWIDRPEIDILETEFGSKKSICTGQHDTFRSHSTENSHKRRIIFDKKAKVITVNDWLIKENNKTDTLFFFLHFNPALEIDHNGSEIALFSPKKSGDKITLSNKVFENAEIIKGDKEKPFGWYSQSYDSKIESPSLKLEMEFESNLEIETIIKYG
ncbi:heparinase II/III family protein [Fodinibius halophilus]|uniref:Uncharacterized protein n=1 Tax=Fodinibius halophilus TaxID=1736908 RepID=A0A6M1SY40_9BACT|nr:alginate lyase family protein [Fodinibius halophilus]NGP88316.1 hypothetical protein [Fodinibius halophilus]